MRNFKFYQKAETVATVSWLLMDFCWMSNYIIASIIFSTASICFSYLSVKTYFDRKKSEFFLLVASFFWVFMNSLWMCGEISKEFWIIVIAKISFFIVLLFLYIAFYYVKKENNEQAEFKRLKIK